MRSKKAPTPAWLDVLRHQADSLAELLRFVHSYRDGWIDLATMQRGPQLDATDLDDEAFDDLAVLSTVG